MPLSHGLPFYRAGNPLYDTLPHRLAEALRERFGCVVAIDVGANIGDTIAALGVGVRDYVVAIEPNPKFFRYLNQNWGQFEHVRCVQALCAAETGVGSFSFREGAGTASVQREPGGGEMATTSVDYLSATDSRLENINFVKVDTDGFDFDVLRGAKATLTKAQPVVLFECDPFDNANYVRELFEIFDIFSKAGYRRLISYDNRGRLMGCHLLGSPQGFVRDLFRQVTSREFYFDILVMPDELIDSFLESEIARFSQLSPIPIEWPVDLKPFAE